MSTHFLTPTRRAQLRVGAAGRDFLVAGDGVYRLTQFMGLPIPYQLARCEIRGLAPLAPIIFSGLQQEEATIPIADLPFAPSYHILADAPLPPCDPARIFQYVVAREGVFVQASNAALDLLLPISQPCVLPGLASVTPVVRWKYPPVDEGVVEDLLARARAAKDVQGAFVEKLFYLTWDASVGWIIHEPEQEQTATSVRPLAADPICVEAPLQGHSHHVMAAYFSHTDDQDEVTNGGFCVYFVLGRISSARAQIRVRVCLHGYVWEIPASYIFLLPDGIGDAVVGRDGGKA